MPQLYLRPLGFVYGAAAETAIGEGLALRLAGSGIGFSLAELIEGVAGASKRRLISAAALKAARDPDLAALLQRVTAPRDAFAGISSERLAALPPILMGIVNVTPDSFSDGGLYHGADAAVAHAEALVSAGAEILDIGGESTRPGSETVPDEDELARVLPVLEGLTSVHAAISIDTRKASVARAAAARGAAIFNDVSALSFDPESLALAAELKLGVVLMHAQGEPKTMQDNPTYDDVVLEVYDYLAGRIAAATAAGLPPAQIAIDPGIGFGKTFRHNFALLNQLSLFHGLGVPLLVGASRKRFVEGPGGGASPRNREPGSQAAAIMAAAQGVQILRVHDVAGSRQALRVWSECLLAASEWAPLEG
jgi:dihydropteroate synthase